MLNEILTFGTSALGFVVLATLIAKFFMEKQRATADVQCVWRFVHEAGWGFHSEVLFIGRMTEARIIQRAGRKVIMHDQVITYPTRTNP